MKVSSRKGRGKPFSIGRVRKQVKLKKKPSLFKRHSRMMSFIGALIVLATFVVKEIVEEHYRNRIESVDRAARTYAVTTDDEITPERLRAQLDRFNIPPIAPKSEENDTDPIPYCDELDRHSKITNDTEYESKVFNGQTQQLLELLHGSKDGVLSDYDANARAVDYMSHDINELESNSWAAKVSHLRSYDTPQNVKTPAIFWTNIRAVRASYGSTYDKLANQRTESVEIRRVALDLLAQYRGLIEHGAQRSVTFGYFLYAIGWSLNVIGGWFGGVRLEGGD